MSDISIPESNNFTLSPDAEGLVEIAIGTVIDETYENTESFSVRIVSLSSTVSVNPELGQTTVFIRNIDSQLCVWCDLVCSYFKLSRLSSTAGLRVFVETDVFQEGISNGTIPLFLQGITDVPVEVVVTSVFRGNENEATRKCEEHFYYFVFNYICLITHSCFSSWL